MGDVSDDDRGASPGPFKYHLELSPAQLKITHTALHSLLDDFGHEQSDVHRVIREVLDKLPDDHAMRAVRLETEFEIELREAGAPGSAAPDPGPPEGDGSPPSAA
jgi:hypothetical protein